MTHGNPAASDRPLLTPLIEPPLPPKRTTSELSSRVDVGSKSEGEDDMGAASGGEQQQGAITTINVHNPNALAVKQHGAKATLGRTPNHLTLSTTSTLSVGSTGSQARLIQSSHAPSLYQPVMMKDLGKTADEEEPVERSEGGGPGVDDKGGYAAIDRHLNAFNMREGNANIVDYMQNLKVKHLEIQLSEEKQDTERVVASGEGETTNTGGEKGQQEKAVMAEKSKAVVTKSQKERQNETQKSEKLILNIDTSQMEEEEGKCAIKIIKIKSRSRSVSPRRPQARDKSPKGSEEKTAHEESQATERTHGILKRSPSSKSMEGPELLSTPTGILKRSLSPQDLNSQRSSFDSRASPVRSPVDHSHSPVVIVKHKGRSTSKSGPSSRIRSVSASASVCNSQDSESSLTAMSSRAKRAKRSMSTSNFEPDRMSNMDSEASLLSPSYYYNQSCFSSAGSLASNGDNGYYDHGVSSLHTSQERIMTEHAFAMHSGDYRGKRYRSPGNEAVFSRAIEQPTCMQCFLQSRKGPS